MTIGQNTLKRCAMAAAIIIPPLWSIPASAQNAMDAYGNSNYYLCDAKKVAAVWGKSVDQAKAIIGSKILGRLTNLVDQDISGATNVRCNWNDTGLSYNDAQKLAKFWGRSTAEAKTKATRLISGEGNKSFFRSLRSVLR